MKTTYQIRNKTSNGIFIDFGYQHEAERYWNENIKDVSQRDIRYGAILVEHTYETLFEAEKARLEWMLQYFAMTREQIDAQRESKPDKTIQLLPAPERVNEGEGKDC